MGETSRPAARFPSWVIAIGFHRRHMRAASLSTDSQKPNADTRIYRSDLIGTSPGYIAPLPLPQSRPSMGIAIRSTRMNDFGSLVEAEIPRLRRYARALTRDVIRADDLVQGCLGAPLPSSTFGNPAPICALGSSQSCTTSMSTR